MYLIYRLLILLLWISVGFIVYTYFGYPLLVYLLARTSRRPVTRLTHKPQVTLLIAAYNEESFIAPKLENSLALNYPRDRLQILVAADGSSDRTVEIVRGFATRGVELSYSPERKGKLAAINHAMQAVWGEIVIFSDANNLYDPEAISELVAPFSDLGVGAATGAKLILRDGRELSAAEGFYWKYESKIMESETTLSTCTSAIGEILAMRRDCYQPPPEIIVNEDHFFALDLITRGYRVVYVPQARSYEFVSASAEDENERRTRMNAGLFQTISLSRKLLPLNRPLIVWQIISHKYFRAFVPFAMLLALGSNLSLVLMELSENPGKFHVTIYNIFFTGQNLFYLLAIAGKWVRVKGFIGKILYLPTFLVNSNFAVLKGLRSFLLGKQTHIWKRVHRLDESKPPSQ